MLQVYTGEGKGKTTAALGLAVRAAGAGKRVAFIQFDKGSEGAEECYHESVILRDIPGLELLPTGCGRLRPDGTFRFGVTEEDREEARRAVELTVETLSSGKFDVVIVDEILTALRFGMIAEDDLERVLEAAGTHPQAETVLTGRDAPEALLERADLVTEMRKIRHYFDRGIRARPGIEY